MSNTIEYAKIFTQALDQLIEQAPTTAWMTANASRVQYNGGNEFKIANIVLDGLNDYDRATGYEDGAVTLEWETKAFKYDRGRKFRLDAMDVDESNFVANATTVLNEFARTKVVPEIDLLRISELAALGNAMTAGATAQATLKDAVVEIRDTGYDGQLVAHVTWDFLRQLEDELAGKLGSIEVNGISYPALGDVALIPTVASRMITGVSKNALTGVYEKDSEDGLDLDLLITGVDVPLGIVKHNPFKIITPELNQEADAYDIHYRVYHTLEVEDNKAPVVVYVVKA